MPISLGINPKTARIDLMLIYLAKMNIKIKWHYFSKEVFLLQQTLKVILRKLNKQPINK